MATPSHNNDETGIRPPWVEDLLTFHVGKIARQFVLHFNITDYIIDLSEQEERGRGNYIRTGSVIGAPQTLNEYLHALLFEEFSCQSVYTYSLANGLTAKDASAFHDSTPYMSEQESGKRSMQYIYGKYQLQRSPSSRSAGQARDEMEIAETLKLLGRPLQDVHFELNLVDKNGESQESPIAVILDYAEKLIPFHVGQGQGEREQLQALEVVQRWALDQKIRQTNNIIILLTTNIGQIPPGIYGEGSGCRAIRVPLPDENEREAFIRYKSERPDKRFVPLSVNDFGNPAQQAHRLARATQGMRLIDIDNLSRRAWAEQEKKNAHLPPVSPRVKPVLKMEDVQRAKSDVIQAQSAQLLEVVPPVRGFNEIGGMENLKNYLRRRTKLMLSGKQSPLVPSGLLLAGPPGTGKTMIAEALATESGFNLVKMRSIQDKWVGSSERNLELVINLLKDLHPVVVFIDEIDQAMVRRDTGQSGDSGVGARMFARILEEMSNPANRGRILWVAATNRADIIDDALLRRFDRVVPLLVPDVSESCRIFATMIQTIIKQSGGSIQISYGGDLAQSGNIDATGQVDPGQEDLQKFLPVAELTTGLGLTGASIEIIVRRAIEIAYEEAMDAQKSNDQADIPYIASRHLLQAVHDFKPNHNRSMYDYQSLLALRACNFYSVIPSLPTTGIYTAIQRPDGTIDARQLEEAISTIERNI